MNEHNAYEYHQIFLFQGQIGAMLVHMNGESWDTRVRLAAFQWLDEQTWTQDETLTRVVLQKGFLLDGQQVHLMSPQGIFTPKNCLYPLSISTVRNGPYMDRFEDAHRLLYRYRGTDPGHRDNSGLRSAMRDNVPLVYFFAVAEGRYQTIKPVYVTGDDPKQLTFTIMADVAGTFDGAALLDPIANQHKTELRREYATAAVQVRLYQSAFRERVLEAYQTHCAMCRLKHRELLDAAHIIPDKDPEGVPTVTNALALCKIHHAAFDKRIIGIRPDYVIQVRKDVLNEEDGPMLKYGLQSLNNTELLVPIRIKDQPSKAALERRYQEFTQ